MAVVIVMGGEVIYTRGFGLRDVEHNKSVTPDTLFRIGSDTKAFTAMATVMSQDDGKLSLEDSPKKYLPYFKLQDPEANLKVTVRDLLCHRAGLGRTDNIEFTGMLTRAEVIRVIGMAKPIARFREKFIYNNAMFAVAGEVVAKAQHSTWDKVITDQIFLPLGMDSSNLSLSEMLRSPDFAYGYQYLPETKETKQAPPANLEAVAPAGAINSNARDMAQWLRFMLARGVWNGKRLVSEAGYNELITEQIKISSSVGYGLGWYLVESMRQKVAIDFETLGINGEGVIIAKAPNLWAVRTTRYALGKRIGASFSYFDGKNGGGDGYKLSGSDLDDERIDDEFYGLLDWRTLFKKVEIKSKRQVGNEEAYLVVAAPEHGSPVAYYISSKSFLLLKRERRGADTSLFEDYRKVAGEMSPFKITYITPGGQRNVYRVKEIKFDVDVPDAEFSPQ